MGAAKVTIVINVQFGDFDKLLSEYLEQLPQDKRDAADVILGDFMYWLLKRDTARCKKKVEA